MAGNDTAALVVALSAQLTKFEKDMQGAVGVANKRTKEIENRFEQMNQAISGQFGNFAQNAAARLGPLGAVITSLGPIGLAVAASIGTLALAFSFVSDKVDAFVEKSKALKEAAETAGLSITQFRLLSSAGKEVGLDFEQTQAFVNRLTVALDDLKTKGAGPLFDALLRIDAGLLREVASSKDAAAAIDVLAKGYSNLTDQMQKNTLVAAVAGKRNLSAGRLLDFVDMEGGLAGLEKKSIDAGKKIDEALTNHVVKLKREIEAIKRSTDNLWGSTFSVEVLEQQKRSAEFWERISRAILASKSNTANMGGVGGPDDFMMPPAFQSRGVPKITVTPLTPPTPAVSVPLPPSRQEQASPVPTAIQLELMRKWTSLLGDAITPAEALTLKILELKAAQEKGGVSTAVHARALDAFKEAQARALLSTREQLGIATEQEIVERKLAQLSRDAVKLKLSENDVQQATVIILREAKEAADHLTVRQAYLPGLKQMEIDAQNARKTLDTFAVGSLNNLENALVSVVDRTKTAAEAFRAMAASIIQDLARMAIRQAITGPLAGALGGLFGGGGVDPIASFGGVRWIGQNAGGTDNWPGGMSWVGERGPELVNLPRGARVIPNHIATKGGSSPTDINIHINLEGANGDETIRRIAYQAAAEGSQQALRRVPAIAISSVTRHRSNNPGAF